MDNDTMFLFAENKLFGTFVTPEQETVLEGFFKLATTILEVGQATLYLYDPHNHLLLPFLEYTSPRSSAITNAVPLQFQAAYTKVVSRRNQQNYPIRYSEDYSLNLVGGDLNMPIRLNGRLISVFQASELPEHTNHASSIQVLELLVEQLTVNLSITRQLNNVLTPALLDPVTRLPNRLFLENFLKADIDHSARHRFEMAMVVVHLQNLISLCETFAPGQLWDGLPLLDYVTCRVSQLLQPTLNENDVMVRLDSVSFGIILHQYNEISAYRVARRFYQILTEDSHLAAIEPGVEVRFGVSSYPYLATDATTLINQAVLALQTGRKQDKSASSPVKIWKASPGADLEKLNTLEDLQTCRAILQGFNYFPISRPVYRRLDPNLIPLHFARQNVCVPVKCQRNSVLTVAMLNPTDHELVAQLARLTGYHVLPVVSTRTEIENALNYLSRTAMPKRL